jgi:hypothetical protein
MDSGGGGSGSSGVSWGWIGGRRGCYTDAGAGAGVADTSRAGGGIGRDVAGGDGYLTGFKSGFWSCDGGTAAFVIVDCYGLCGSYCGCAVGGRCQC